MSGVRRYQSHDGPHTYEVAEAVKGGMLIVPNSAVAGDKTVKKAGAGATKVLGVAEIDARPFVDPVSTDADGFETLNIAPMPQETTAGFGVYPVTYAADCAFGAALKTAANGQVTPWATGVDAADLVVGYCAEPGGVVVATKATGLANISR